MLKENQEDNRREETLDFELLSKHTFVEYNNKYNENMSYGDMCKILKVSFDVLSKIIMEKDFSLPGVGKFTMKATTKVHNVNSPGSPCISLRFSFKDSFRNKARVSVRAKKLRDVAMKIMNAQKNVTIEVTSNK